jgi:tetratricopeptide (TPR) repeat protein
VDWFWEFPGLGATAFAMRGIACALAPRRGAPRPVAPGLWPVALTGALFAAAVAFAMPWIAEREMDRAAEAWRKNPQEALDRLDRAAQLNSLSARPRLTAGVIAVNLGRLDIAESELRDALERDPRNEFAALELGAVLSRRGRRDEAVAILERASRLAPRDPVARMALRQARAGKRLDPIRLNQQILARGRARLR